MSSRRHASSTTTSTSLTLHKAFSRPHLEYAIQVSPSLHWMIGSEPRPPLYSASAAGLERSHFQSSAGPLSAPSQKEALLSYFYRFTELFLRLNCNPRLLVYPLPKLTMPLRAPYFYQYRPFVSSFRLQLSAMFLIKRWPGNTR